MTDAWSALDLTGLPAPLADGIEPAQALFTYAADITNALTRHAHSEGVVQASRLLSHAGLRFYWAEAGYRLTVVGKDPDHPVTEGLAVNPYELMSAGASLAVRESATVLDLAAAALWRWDHPGTEDSDHEKSLRGVGRVRPRDIGERRLAAWLEAAQGDEAIRKLVEDYRHGITHRAPGRGATINIGARFLTPPDLGGVPVDEMARFAVAVASRWYVDLLLEIAALTDAAGGGTSA